jgi:hypothetical protein
MYYLCAVTELANRKIMTKIDVYFRLQMDFIALCTAVTSTAIAHQLQSFEILQRLQRRMKKLLSLFISVICLHVSDE